MNEEEKFVADYFKKMNAFEYYGGDQTVVDGVLKTIDTYYESAEEEDIDKRIISATEDWLDKMIDYENPNLTYKEIKDFVSKHKTAIDDLLRENGTYNDLYNKLEYAETEKQRKEALEDMIHNALFEFAFIYLNEKYGT